MKRYLLHNPNTFDILGYFDAETQEDALDQAAHEAGYADYATAAEAGFVAVADEVTND